MNISDKIQAVLVLYKCKLEDSETFVSLTKAIIKNNDRVDLLVYDNSPESYFDKNVDLGYPGNITYIHDESNPGICKPYNIGFEKAVVNNRKWLLLLDQDTDITSNYIKSLLKSVEEDKNYVSIVPVVYSNNNIVSPTRYGFLGRMKAIKEEEINKIVSNITAINSGACISIEFLNEIGGFNTDFPLDMLDHWLNSKIAELRKSSFILNSSLIHSLSISDYNSLGIDRYMNILISESKFYMQLGLYHNIIFIIRLLLRSVKLLYKGFYSHFLLTVKFVFLIRY